MIHRKPNRLIPARRPSGARSIHGTQIEKARGQFQSSAAGARGCGADVVRCDSAASTLDALVSTPVHLIVADLGMPDVDGFDLIDQVRRMENGSGRAPAIAVSAYSRPEYRDKALTVGYSAYCSKPVDAFEFLRVVDQVLKASGAGSRAL